MDAGTRSAAVERKVLTARDSNSPPSMSRAARTVSGPQGRFDGLEQRVHPECHVLDAAIYEERGGAAHAAVASTLQVLAHPLEVDVIVDVRNEPRHVELQP